VKRVSIAILFFWAFAGLMNPVYAWAFTIFSVTIVAAIPFREHFMAKPSVFQYRFESHVYGFRRARRVSEMCRTLALRIGKVDNVQMLLVYT